MSERLVLEATPFGVSGALFGNDRLIDLPEAEEPATAVTDALFLGRVTRIDARLNAAFVDIGLGEPAFLNAKDARFGPSAGAAGRDPGSRDGRVPMGKLLREGERLIVQGLREAEPPIGGAQGKGPRVTTDLKLFGFHLIQRPFGRPSEFPARTRGADRQRLQERGEQLFPGHAVVLRKLGGSVDDTALVDELAALTARWEKLSAEAVARSCPGRLAADDHALERLLRAVFSPQLTVLEAADAALLARVQQILQGPLAPHAVRLVRLDSSRSAFEQTGVTEAIEEALAREVPLRGGGRLIVEPVAAFTAIDVDGAGRAALDVDLEAAAELARLSRLRNFGGTIVVDFVDLPAKPQQQRLDAALKKAFRDDPLPVDVLPMSPLGIVQISRAKRGSPLDTRLRRACPVCDGTGRLAALRMRLEALTHELRGRPSLPARIRVAPDLRSFLDGAGKEAWQRSGSPGVAEPDATLSPGEYRLDG